MMALNRNNNFYRLRDLRLWSQRLWHAAFRKSPPALWPWLPASNQMSKVVRPSGRLQSHSLKTVVEGFVALQADFLEIFHGIHFLVIWELRAE